MSVALKLQEDSDGYPDFEALIKERIEENRFPLFTVSTDNLFEVFLDNIVNYRRQHYNCRCCKKFFERYGGLVTIDDDGVKDSLLWQVDMVPSFFKPAVKAVKKLVEGRVITNQFVSSEQMFGYPETGEWTHLHGQNPKVVVNPLKTSHQLMAEKLEDYDILHRSILEFPLEIAAEAVRVIKRLVRSEKALGCAEWFVKLHTDLRTAVQKNQFNVIWKYVAEAPAGWCHIRTSMIGTVLEDLKEGNNFAVIEKKWNDKMDPLKYQRPTTVKAGNIERAEEVFLKLGAQSALPRRFAEFGDVKKFVWIPYVQGTGQRTGLIESVTPKSTNFGIQTGINLASQVMTWEKFKRTVLPEAKTLEFFTPHRGNYVALVTAQDPDSYPMLQWDCLEDRNNLSHYVYVGGSAASAWNLTASTWVKVNGICPDPAHQGTLVPSNHADRAIVILDKAYDINYRTGGLFFPENLKSELREVRSVVEQFSNNNSISGRGSAHGYIFSDNTNFDGGINFRVNGKDQYKIDRWD